MGVADALVAMVSVPLTAPCAVGANVTPIFTDLPGPSVSGSTGAAATANCDGLAVMPLTFKLLVPEFCSATISGALVVTIS